MTAVRVYGIEVHWDLRWRGRKPGTTEDVVEEAGALWESLSQNHPFLDGNKRTAITAAAMFLRISGYRLTFEDREAYDG